MSLAVSALLVAILMLMKVNGGMSPFFALALIAGSQVGFFAIQALKKSGVSSPNAEFLFVGAVFACFFIAVISFSAFQLFVPLLFAPLVLCAPAAAGVVGGILSG